MPSLLANEVMSLIKELIRKKRWDKEQQSADAYSQRIRDYNHRQYLERNPTYGEQTERMAVTGRNSMRREEMGSRERIAEMGNLGAMARARLSETGQNQRANLRETGLNQRTSMVEGGRNRRFGEQQMGVENRHRREYGPGGYYPRKLQFDTMNENRKNMMNWGYRERELGLKQDRLDLDRAQAMQTGAMPNQPTGVQLSGQPVGAPPRRTPQPLSMPATKPVSPERARVATPTIKPTPKKKKKEQPLFPEAARYYKNRGENSFTEATGLNRLKSLLNW